MAEYRPSLDDQLQAQPENGSSAVEGKVNQVCRQWLIHEDGAIAHQMQASEFERKHGFNRNQRRTVRGDIPVAKSAQQEEEERLQHERMKQILQQNSIQEQDALYARQMAEELEKQGYLEQKNDEMVARQINEKINREAELERLKNEIRDLEVARAYQHKEQLRYEQYRQERRLRKERRKLEEEISKRAQESDQALSAYKKENLPELRHSHNDNYEEPDKFLRVDGKVEDVGDFSDFYLQPDQSMPVRQRQELQELQDEELARLLQEQEHKRGAHVKIDQQKIIAQQDAELARIMQEQERLKMERLQNQPRQPHKQKSLPAEPPPQTHDLPPAHGTPPAALRSTSYPSPGVACEDPALRNREFRESGRLDVIPPTTTPTQFVSTDSPSRGLNNTPRSRPECVTSTTTVTTTTHVHKESTRTQRVDSSSRGVRRGALPPSPPETAAGNAFATIDPTFSTQNSRVEDGEPIYENMPGVDDDSPPTTPAPPPPHGGPRQHSTTQSTSASNIRDDDVEVVQAQKRSSANKQNKLEKQKSCKQQ